MEFKICALTGHRPKGFPWNYRDKSCKEQKEYLKMLEDTIIELIEKDGFNYFISGGAIGADQDFAEIVIKLKKHYPNIQLEIAVPCPNQDVKWNSSDKARYKQILENSDLVNILSTSYTPNCMQKRNEYMVDKIDFVIVVWNGEPTGGTYNTLCYIKHLNKSYEIINLKSENGK